MSSAQYPHSGGDVCEISEEENDHSTAACADSKIPSVQIKREAASSDGEMKTVDKNTEDQDHLTSQITHDEVNDDVDNLDELSSGPEEELTVSDSDDDGNTKEMAVNDNAENSVQLYKCTECEYVATSVNDIQNHIAQHAGVSPTTSTTKSKDKKLTSKESSESKSFKCLQCNVSYVSKRNLTRHNNDKHADVTTYPCSQCEFSCDVRTDLQNHMKSTHPDSKPFICLAPNCIYSTHRPDHLQRHKKSHEQNKPKSLKCPHCHAKCTEERNLLRHITTKHPEIKKSESKKKNSSPKEISHEQESDKITCSFCDYTTYKRQRLRSHLKYRHTGEKPHACGQCDYRSVEPGTLKRHIIAVHTSEKAIQCKLCDFKCKTAVYLKGHMREIHIEEKRFKCDLCEYSTWRRQHFTAHLTIHTGEKPYVCLVCGFCCSRPNSLKRHVKTHEAKNTDDDTETVTKFNGELWSVAKKGRTTIHKCSECDFTTYSRQHLTSHTKYRHTFEKGCMCSFCGYSCVQLGALKRHIMARHTLEKPHKCGLCEYGSVTKLGLNRHMYFKHSIGTVKKYVKSRPIRKCTYEGCEYESRSANSISHHVMSKHTGVRPFVCNFCAFSCITRNTLQVHIMSRHTKEKPRKCEFCDYRCVQMTSLKQHTMARHTGEKPFMCVECGHMCTSKGNLNLHTRSKHSNLKPYSCKLCDYKCKQSTSLKAHIRSRHTHEKPYSCPHCDYACAVKADVQKHVMARHTGQKPYQCSYCDYRAVQSTSLKAHMRSRHGHNLQKNTTSKYVDLTRSGGSTVVDMFVDASIHSNVEPIKSISQIQDSESSLESITDHGNDLLHIDDASTLQSSRHQYEDVGLNPGSNLHHDTGPLNLIVDSHSISALMRTSVMGSWNYGIIHDSPQT